MEILTSSARLSDPPAATRIANPIAKSTIPYLVVPKQEFAHTIVTLELEPTITYLLLNLVLKILYTP